MTTTPISFQSESDQIAGHLVTPEGAKLVNLAFLLIQGWTGRQNLGAAQALADLGLTCLTYDMRGNRSSGGELAKLSRADFLQDAVIAYDFLAARIPATTPIGVIGSSFGSYTAILLAEHRPIACLSLRVPANYPEEGFNDPHLPQIQPWRTSEWRQKTLTPNDNHTLSVLHAFTGPVQIVEAESDEIVPHQTVQNYAQTVPQAQLRHDVMKDAPHSLTTPALQAEYVALLTNWAKRQLP